MDEKKCGTCDYWASMRGVKGWCDWDQGRKDLPYWLEAAAWTFSDNGGNCDAWVKRDERNDDPPNPKTDYFVKGNL